MFTVSTVQNNVMCMMNKEMCMDMCMYMSMFDCALMYRKLPGASKDHG